MIRAAQYVRMSAEAQEYSIANQAAAIAAYAASRGFEIVRSYADPAKSGLDIKRRPGLQKLIDDVVGGTTDFGAVLVYDVSRWGRFQDNDEAACYEFLCKRAGISLHYCAEPFINDGTLASSFLKMVKRTMAAEYLRELSVKVQAGQHRLASLGFKQGGRAGYGLRRLLLDGQGHPKMVLESGERKSLTTERVTYILGPDEEVQAVRDIYSLFLAGRSVTGIAKLLNERGVKRPGLGAWTFDGVHKILSHPKYTGCLVYNRFRMRLGSKASPNPREQWVLKPGVFPAIITKEMFEQVQQRLGNMTCRRSDEDLLRELRAFVELRGKTACHELKTSNNVAGASTYFNRFGSLTAAYEKIGYRAARYTVASVETKRTIAKLTDKALQELLRELSDRGMRVKRHGFILRPYRGKSLIVRHGTFIKTKGDEPRWIVYTRSRWCRYVNVIIRLEPGNAAIKDFVLLHSMPRVDCSFRISEETVQHTGCTYRCSSALADAVSRLNASHAR